MNQNQFTQKSMEALQRAQALASEYSQQTLEQAHLLYALLENPQGLISQLLTKMNRTRHIYPRIWIKPCRRQAGLQSG